MGLSVCVCGGDCVSVYACMRACERASVRVCEPARPPPGSAREGVLVQSVLRERASASRPSGSQWHPTTSTQALLLQGTPYTPLSNAEAHARRRRRAGHAGRRDGGLTHIIYDNMIRRTTDTVI